jgi:hypothetical protein
MAFEGATRAIYDDGPYMIPHTRPQNRTNVLLVKNQLGKVKPTTRTLPPPDHRYGYVEHYDSEGAKEVLQHWQQHTPNPAPTPSTDFKALNKYGAMNGCVTAKHVSAFRRTNHIPMSEGYSNQPRDTYFPDENQVYGIKSSPSAVLHSLLSNSFARQAIIENRITYGKRAAAKQARRTQKLSTYQTKASLGHTKVPAPQPKPRFILRQFQDVPSRVTLGQYAGATRRVRTTGSIRNGGAPVQSTQQLDSLEQEVAAQSAR